MADNVYRNFINWVLLLKESIEGECQVPEPEPEPEDRSSFAKQKFPTVESCDVLCAEDFTCESYFYIFDTQKCDTFPYPWFNCTAIIGTLMTTKCDNSKIFGYSIYLVTHQTENYWLSSGNIRNQALLVMPDSFGEEEIIKLTMFNNIILSVLKFN